MLFLVTVGMVLLIIVLIFLTQSVRSAVPDHGDYWSDAHILINVRAFTRYGFEAMRFSIASGYSVRFLQPYLSHPSFMYLLLGLFSRWGVSEVQLRLFPLVVSCSSALAIYVLVKKMVNARVGMAAAAVALCAPAFRYLADAYCYQSYDFAFKSWAILCITLGAVQPQRRAAVYWTILGAAIGSAGLLLSSWETCMTIGVYAALAPIVLYRGNWRERVLRACLSGVIVGSLMMLAVILRLAFNAWVLGGWSDAINVWAERFRYRTQATLLREYLPGLLYRIWSYYSVHTVLIGVGAAIFVLFNAARRARTCPAPRTIGWLGLLLGSELMWFVIFQEHAYRHVHTLGHVFLTVNVAAGISIYSLTELAATLLRLSTLRRYMLYAALIAVVCGLLLSDVGVQPHGNLQKEMDLTWELERGRFLRETIPSGSLVFVRQHDSPLPLLLMDREYVLWNHSELPDVDLQQEDVYLLWLPEQPSDPLFQAAMQNTQLVGKGFGVAVFRLGTSSP